MKVIDYMQRIADRFSIKYRAGYTEDMGRKLRYMIDIKDYAMTIGEHT